MIQTAVGSLGGAACLPTQGIEFHEARMTAERTAVKAIGEVALRVNDLNGMKHFYQEVLGLQILGEFPTAVLLKIADGYDGHTQVLALFDRSTPVGHE